MRMQCFDLNLDNGDPVITDDISFIKQEIRILFDSRMGDLMGDPNYGTDYEKFLYEWQTSNGALEQQMKIDLGNLDLRGFTPEINVYFMQGTERDIAVIDVELTRNTEHQTILYKIV